MARKTKEEASKTRQIILDTALKLFCEQGMTETSLTDIATTAGVTRGAIYWHFKNKNDLFITIWEEFCEPLSNLIDSSIREDEPDPLGKLRFFLMALLDRMSRDPTQRQIFIILFSLDKSHQDIVEIHQHTHVKYQQFLQDLEQSLTNAIKRGQLSPTFNSRIGAHLISATINGYILKCIQDNDSKFHLNQAEPLIDMLIGMFEDYHHHTPN
ncbi:TetR family transcriptional regulator [Celerinatantimonas yamalensis]|uniref:TetR family transcriptional regulator n=1 Tax=Celerinatantimonas yamalensis TaxID=559956 RepID=A0ABW9G8N4_9GAMM